MTGFADRLEGLVAEAREAGALGELASTLAAAAREARELSAEDVTDEDVPGRFGIVGESDAIKAVFELIERVAPADVPVLVQGDTGTGKELVARAIHERSGRKGRFLAENCAAVPAELLESELFGHTKGSFTGAIADRPGHFVAADEGTLFLDEIGDMPLLMQSKLLRALETSEVRPVGSNKEIKVDVRLVAASHRDLAAMVDERAFRQDLYYRLNVVRIPVPRLKDRNGDIPHLARYFLARASGKAGAGAGTIDDAAMAALCAYSWPGNVRQLENEIKRAVALTGGSIGLADLTDEVRRGETTS